MIVKLAFLIQPFLFGSNMLIARYSVGEFPPIALAFWRWSMAFIIFLPFIIPPFITHYATIRDQFKAHPFQQIIRFLMLGACGMGICGACVYIGAQTTQAINIAIIYTVSPIFIVLLSLFLQRDKPVRIAEFIGVMVAFCGVLLVISKGNVDRLMAINFNVGDLWILLSAVAWALYTFLNERWHSAVLPQVLILAQIILGGMIVLFPFMLYEGVVHEWPTLNYKNIGIVLFLAIISSIGSYKTYAYLLEKLGGNLAGLTLYLAPLSTALIGYIWLGEAIEVYHGFGLILVLSGIALTSSKPPSFSLYSLFSRYKLK